MNKIISQILAQIKGTIKSVLAIGGHGIATYAVHALFVFLAAVALHFGWHVSVPVLPTALASMTGFGVLRWVVKDLSKVFHLGRIEAEAEKTVENYVATLGSFIKNFADLAAEEPAAPAAPSAKHDGAYL